MAKKIVVLFSLLLLLTALSAPAQEDSRYRIAIIPMENGTGLEQYNPLCSTISDTISLVMEFLKDYRVLDEKDFDPDGLAAQNELSRLRSLAREEGIDGIIFGRMQVLDDVFEFTLSLYDVEDGEIAIRQVAEAYSVLEVFDAADELTEGLISQLSGRAGRLRFGQSRTDRGEGELYGKPGRLLPEKPGQDLPEGFKRCL